MSRGVISPPFFHRNARWEATDRRIVSHCALSSVPPTELTDGSSTYRNVWMPDAPRSIDASITEPEVRRRRASTLL